MFGLIHGRDTGAGTIRLRQARITSQAQIANRIITVGVRLASIPLAIAILGREEYGVWLTMLSLITWFAMSDLGLPSALMNPLAVALGKHESKTVSELISTSAFLLTALGLLMGIIGVGLVLLLPIERILGMSLTAFNNEVRWAFVIVVVFNISFLQLRISTVIPSAMQKGYLVAIFDTLTELIILAGLVMLRFTGGNLVSFALVMSMPMAVGRFLLWVFVCFRFGVDFVPRIRYWSISIVRQIGSPSLMFFAGSLGELLVIQTPIIVVAQLLGAAYVPLFAIPFQLFYSAYATLNFIAIPLWPAYVEANAISDWKWIRRTHWRIMRDSLLLGSVGFIALGFISKWFISIWVGPDYTPSIGLLIFLVLLFIQWTWNFVFVVLLTGLGLIRERTLSVIAFGFINILLSVVLTSHFGVIGVVLSLLISMAMTQTWFLLYSAHKKSRWLFRA